METENNEGTQQPEEAAASVGTDNAIDLNEYDASAEENDTDYAAMDAAAAKSFETASVNEDAQKSETPVGFDHTVDMKHFVDDLGDHPLTVDTNSQPSHAQPAQSVQPNFNDQVNNAATPDVTSEHPHYPGGVEAPKDSQPVLTIGYDQESGRYDFTDALENIDLDDTNSGAATVTINVTGHSESPGQQPKKCGYITARIVGDHAGRVYIFRKDNLATNTTQFVASFTYVPA